jgi:hypothetical protein
MATRKPTIQERFERFHAENPHVYEMFVRFARQLRARRARGSAAMIFERMRWETAITTSDPHFKLNDQYTSRYARLAMAQEPDLAGFFEVRELRSGSSGLPEAS